MDLYQALAMHHAARFLALHWEGNANHVAIVDIDATFRVHVVLLPLEKARAELRRRAHATPDTRRSYEDSMKGLTKLAKQRGWVLVVLVAEGHAWVGRCDAVEIERLRGEPNVRILEIVDRCDTQAGARDAVVALEPLWGKVLHGRLYLELLRRAIVDHWDDDQRILERMELLRIALSAFGPEWQRIVNITLAGLEIAIERRNQIRGLQLSAPRPFPSVH